MPDDQHHDGDPARTPPKRALLFISAPIIALIVITYISDALFPKLVVNHPLTLILMSSRNRNLIATTGNLDAVSYYLAGTARLLISDPLFFLLGYWYGEAAMRWMEKRTKTFGESLRMIERSFAKAAYPLVFIAPNNYICLFAGAAGMSVPAFFAVNTAGTLVRLYLIRRLGEAFDAPIKDVIDWIRDHQGPLLIVSICLTIFFVIRELRGGEIDSLTHLEEELEEAEAEVEAEHEQET